MGTYVNPGNDGFRTMLRGEYVDKTGIIGLINETLGTDRKLVAVTRPRRFGKSFAAKAVVAYYSCGCDSAELFEGLAVSRTPAYAKHLNAHNVVRLDMTGFTRAARGKDVVPLVEAALMPELRDVVPDAGKRGQASGTELTSAILDVVRATGRGFVFVIDEWDAPLRECPAEEDKRSWVELLRELFKNGDFTDEAIDAAYITGILPIRRYRGQSAVSDFREFTMLRPARYAPYVGFTEDEVEALAGRHGMDMEELRHWYDGYELKGAGHVYAPYSVMLACENEEVGDYWPATASFDSIRTYIDLDLDGLQQAVLRLVGGSEERVDTGKFANDINVVRGRDDALTLLAHLGYLAFRPARGKEGFVRVPNEEVREELVSAVEESHHARIANVVRQSEALLHATWDMDAEAVAAGIAAAHDAACDPVHYNGEQALRSVVRAAYLAAVDFYARVEELPSGHGYADVAYLPRRGAGVPALVVELKWNRQPCAAIGQILDRNYPSVLRDLGCPILLVGITYDSKTKLHSCHIERA